MPIILLLALCVGLLPGTVSAESWHGCALAPNGRDAWVATIDTTIVCHSPDFGISWTNQPIYTNHDFFDIFFLDELTGWVCGTLAEVHKTTDGGNTWTQQGYGASKHFARLQFLDATHGWAAAGSAIMGRWNETDQTWEQVILPNAFPSETCDFYGISFVDTLHGWMCAGRYPVADTFTKGQGWLTRTLDGGYNWTLLLRDTIYDYFDLKFANVTTGWAVGGNDRTMKGYITRTTDGGTTWSGQVYEQAGMLRGVEFIGPRLGWAVGMFGTILHTTDGGVTWSPQTSGVDSTLFDVDFSDSLRGMASGRDAVVFTTDGGGTWLSSMPDAGDTGWTARANMLAGSTGKPVKDGGCLAWSDADDGLIYALKGNNTCEFQAYSVVTDAWSTRDSIPAVGTSGKKKKVKKGACLTATRGKVYAAKGNGTLEFWRYGSGGWAQLADIPAGAKTVKEGAGLVPVVAGDTTFIYLLKGSGTQEFHRYNVLTNAWEAMADAPLGLSGRAFKNGSCIATGNGSVIYALKGSYNEFSTYDVAANTWSSKAALPLIGSSGKKKKVKDGAGLAADDGMVYALKGNNTQEFHVYTTARDSWRQLADIPAGGGRRVKGGGALTACASRGSLYALKGNATLEFYSYQPAIEEFGQWFAGSTFAAQSAPGPRTGLDLAVATNPLSDPALVHYSLPVTGPASLRLFDVNGRLVTTLFAGTRPAGSHSTAIRELPARGVYLLRLESNGRAVTEKVIVE